MRSRTPSILVAASILATFVMVSSEVGPAPRVVAADGAWTTYRGGAARIGVADSAGPAGSPLELWRVQTQNIINSEPAVVGGVVYIGSNDGSLYALDAATGNEHWHFTTGDAVSSSPAVADGVVYVGSADGNLYAVDATTESERWRSTGAREDASPAVADGVVYSGSANGNLYAVDAGTGATLWSTPLGAEASRSPAVAEGSVYIGSGDSVVHAVDAATGAERWAFQADAGTISTPVVADGVVYECAFEDAANALYALDAATGAERWRFSTESGESVWVPIVDGGMVYTPSSDGRLYALDATTGEVVWQFQTGDVVDSSATLADGVIYMLSNDRHLYALNAASGEELWQLEVDGGADKGPSVVDGIAYFGTQAGTVWAVGEGGPAAAASPVADASARATDTVAEVSTNVLPEMPADDPGPPLWEASGPKLAGSATGNPPVVAPDGNIWVPSSNDSVFWIFAPDGTYLESWGTPGTGDGQFDFTRSDGSEFGDVAFDTDGTFYVADVGNHRIEKFDPGRRFVSAWGSFGQDDGQFSSPNNVATDGRGHIYVGDDGRADVQAFTSDGEFIRSFGSGEGSTDASWFVAVDPVSEDVLVAVDSTVLRYSSDGQLISSMDAPFDQPICLDVDATGNVYVGGDVGRVNEGTPDSVVVVDATGTLVRRLAMTGDCPGVTPDGSLLLIDHYDWDHIEAFGLSPVGTATQPSANAPELEPSLQMLWETALANDGWGVAIDPTGEIWVSTSDSVFEVFDREGNYLRTFGTPGREDGQLDLVNEYGNWGGVAFRPDGGFYVSDTGNQRIQEFDADGDFVRAAGSFGAGDGQFHGPDNIDVDDAGNVYVMDPQREDIQVFDSDLDYLRTFGSGEVGPFFDVDPDGTVYAADEGNMALMAYRPDGSKEAVGSVAGLMSFITGIEHTPQGRTFVASELSGGSVSGPENLAELGPDGTVIHLWPDGGWNFAIDPAGDRVYMVTDKLRAYALPAE